VTPTDQLLHDLLAEIQAARTDIRVLGAQFASHEDKDSERHATVTSRLDKLDALGEASRIRRWEAVKAVGLVVLGGVFTLAGSGLAHALVMGGK